ALAFMAFPTAFAFGAIAGWRRSFCSAYFAAKHLDRHLGLHDRLSNAYYFLSQDPQRRSPLAALAIEDGLRAARAAKLSARGSVRWPPRATFGLALSVVCVGMLWALYPSKNVPADQAVAVEKQNEMLH